MLNTSFLDALAGKPTSYTPLWLMRQAGRYLPEYLKTRQLAGSFMDLAQNPSLATQVTLQPLDRYDLDAAILFSDILTIPDAMGLGLHFIAGEGPKFNYPLQSEHSIKNLRTADMSKLQYVFDAVSSIIKALRNNLTVQSQRLPLIGFSGSPFTLACYMIEGSGSSNNFEYTRSIMYSRSDLFEHILEINTLSVIEYLSLQIQAGVNAVMIFDTWGGLLSQANYIKYSLKYIQKIIKTLKEKYPHIPCIVFTKGGGVWLEQISAIQPDAIGVDWTIDIGKARKIVPNSISLQGNLDPIVLRGSQENIIMQTKDMLDSYYSVNRNLSRYIANLGHGISQHTNPENVAIFVDTLKDYSKTLIKLR